MCVLCDRSIPRNKKLILMRELESDRMIRYDRHYQVGTPGDRMIRYDRHYQVGTPGDKMIRYDRHIK